MKRLLVPVVAVVVIALGSYTMFAQPGNMPQGGAGGGDMMGGMEGMMSNMSCGGPAMHVALVATADGGVIVAAGGKLIRYDAAFQKLNEVDLPVDLNGMPRDQTQAGQPKPATGTETQTDDHAAHHPS